MAVPPTALSRGELCATHSAIPSIWWCIQLLALSSHLIPPPSLNGGEQSSLPGCVQPSDMVDSESVMGFKPSDSGVVIRYQVYEFTCIWLSEHFIA